jgi:predicted flap endonuclease-1-like 5' DNA nuclease
MTTIVAFILGLIIGWVAEWVVDWFYWRKRTRQAEQKAAHLESQLAQLQTEHANEFAALQADIAERDEQLEAIEAELTELPAEEEAAAPEYEMPAPEAPSGLGAFAAGAAVASLLDSDEEPAGDLTHVEEEESTLVGFPISDEEETLLAEMPVEAEDELQQIAPIPAFLLEEEDETQAADIPAFLDEELPVDELPEEEGAPEEVLEAEQAAPEDELAKYKKDIEYVEGIGPVYGEKLREAGVPNPLLLLQRGATSKGRAEIAEHTGIRPELILKWVNHVDLYRIKGIGSEYADLLEVAGVDTVVELATRNPDNLYERMIAVNADKKLVRQPPSPAQVQNWIEQAKILPRVVTY